MKRVVYAPEFSRAIDDIFDFTTERWGILQAEAYVKQIFARIDGLAQGRLEARPRKGVLAEFQFLRAGRHVVVVRPSWNRLEVLTVLHEAMDIEARIAALMARRKKR
jgi:toxin ParE1/3/4